MRVSLCQLLLLLLSDWGVDVDGNLRPQEFQDDVPESDGFNLDLDNVSDVEVSLKGLH